MLPETLAAHTEAAGAERVDQRDGERPALAHHLPHGLEEEEHRERRHDRRRELLEAARPVGVGLGAQQDGQGVYGQGQDAGSRGIGRQVMAAPVLQVVGDSVQERVVLARGLIEEGRELIEREGVLPQKAPRQISRRKGVAGADALPVRQVRGENRQEEQEGRTDAPLHPSPGEPGLCASVE
jgi:hypothetical protein